MRLDHAWIQTHIPHQGRMCLLDEVLEWNHQVLRCRASSHRDVDNPLRARGVLGIACGVEYAAQAMAIHGVLSRDAASQSGVPLAGFLASLRGVRFHAQRLDDVTGELFCNVERIAGDSASALYEFELRSHAALLMSGRASVIMDANMRLSP